MNESKPPSKVQSTSGSTEAHLHLDESALEAAKQNLGDGTVTPSYGPWRDDIVKLLNDALATELVCILRYKRHHYTAKGLASTAIAEEFMVHAQEETAPPEQLAEPTVPRGGEPDFSPASPHRRTQPDYA